MMVEREFQTQLTISILKRAVPGADGKLACCRLPRSLLLVGLAFCLSSVVARADELTAKETAVAQRLYKAKCAKCHKFYDPKDYAQPEWDVWMQKMGKKSKLKPEQLDLLSRYIDSNLRPEKKAEVVPKR